MENASKALLIAAAMLIGIIIISLVVIGYNNIAAYFRADEEANRTKQIAKFNSEYESFNRENIRGNDLLGLVNKIGDYNERKADPTDELYEPMCLTITIEDTATPEKEVDLFCIDLSEYNGVSSVSASDKIISTSYTNFKYNPSTGSNEYDKTEDKYDLLSAATKDIKAYSNTWSSYGVSSKIKDNTIQVLSQNVYNIFDVYNKNYDSQEKSVAEAKRNKILKEMFGSSFNTTESNLLKNVECAAYRSYQITQFKRAMFDCTGTRYNDGTARIVQLDFKFNGNFS